MMCICLLEIIFGSEVFAQGQPLCTWPMCLEPAIKSRWGKTGVECVLEPVSHCLESSQRFSPNHLSRLSKDRLPNHSHVCLTRNIFSFFASDCPLTSFVLIGGDFGISPVLTISMWTTLLCMVMHCFLNNLFPFFFWWKRFKWICLLGNYIKMLWS